MTDSELCIAGAVVVALFALAAVLTRAAKREQPPTEAQQRKRYPYWSRWIPLALTVGLAVQAASQGKTAIELVFGAVFNLCIYGIIFGIIGYAFRVPVEDD